MKRAKAPTAGASPSPSRLTEPPRRTWVAKVGFSLVAVVGMLAALEGVLALVGIRPQLYEKDPYVGFSSQSPLFVEQRDGNGRVQMVTAQNRLDFFNRQTFPKTKAQGTYRIFSMGESTTYGHPYTDSTSFNGWLREFLRATAPDRQWEAVNAGGISYGSYRVARLMEELIEYQPDLFVIYVGHNEFLERRIYGKINRMPRGLQGLTGLALRLRSAAVMERVLAPLRRFSRAEMEARTVLESEPVTLLENTLGPTAYKRDEALREQIFRHYQFNLMRMVDVARSVGARVIFVVPASNLREVSPFKSEHRTDLSQEDRQRWKSLYDQAREDFANPIPTNALAALTAAEAIDRLPANQYFVRGRVLEKLGRFEEAKAAYQRALDEDVCSLRAPSEIRRILTQVATELHVPLVDYQAFVEAHSEHGIPGASLFLDHVHPTVEGYRLLALEILKSMEKEGLVRPNWEPAVISRTTEAVLGRIDQRAHSLALMNLCKTLGWAGKREEAYRAGLRAIELGPTLPEVQYQTGLAAQLSGRTNEAVTCYRKALELKPELASARCALGVIYEDQGELSEALGQFQLALKHGQPKDRVRDQRNLDSVLQKISGQSQ